MTGNSAAIIDWCGFTFLESSMEDVPGEAQRLLSHWMGEKLMGEGCHGRNFYQNTVEFFAFREGELVRVAHVAWGGESQNGRANIQINGTGCSIVKDWKSVREFIDSVDGRLTRVDLAVDLLEGEATVDEAMGWYQEGRFNINRQPHHCVHGPWLQEEQGTGRTLEVGRRKNGKMARIYEKGKQLGNPDSPWVRFEGELHNVDRELPSEILVNPSPYFAGMYPCFEALVAMAGSRIATEQKQGETSLARLMECLRASYGKAIYVARIQSHDHVDLFEQMSQPGVPRRLYRSALHLLHAPNHFYSPPQTPAAE
jgi:phage replication initiation protein